MTKNTSDSSNPKGVHHVWALPDAKLASLWDSIILDGGTKKSLVSQSVLNFTIRGKVDRTVLPLHGVILLVGPPGTGKTSLAKGLANQVASLFKNATFQLLEIDPHSLTSSAMGKTQRAVSDLFSQTISEATINGPTIVLLDEVETLAADRSKLSLEANPIDIHRATDAVLVQLDMLAEKHPNLLFIATSNFPAAIDSAFLSRCDLVLEVPLPSEEACKKILKECLVGVAKSYPDVAELTIGPKFETCARECAGLDGRAIRKVVANALAASPETAINPNKVSFDDLLNAIKQAKKVRLQKVGTK